MLCFICFTRLVSICTSVPLQWLVVRLNLNVCLKNRKEGIILGCDGGKRNWGPERERDWPVATQPGGGRPGRCISLNTPHPRTPQTWVLYAQSVDYLTAHWSVLMLTERYADSNQEVGWGHHFPPLLISKWAQGPHLPKTSSKKQCPRWWVKDLTRLAAAFV